MSLLNRFRAIISNIEIADQIHDTGIMKQFIVKGLHGLSYILDITQNDDEELQNVETITNDLLIRYDFLRKVEAINYPEIVTSRSRHLELLVSSIDYYKSAYVFLLDLTKTEKEDANAE